MQITRKQLKQIISEEVENLSEQADKLENLVEGFVNSYDNKNDFVDKQSLIDLLEIMEEGMIPKEAFEAFVNNLPEDSVVKVLSEVVDLND
jgi:hypothetical protein